MALEKKLGKAKPRSASPALEERIIELDFGPREKPDRSSGFVVPPDPEPVIDLNHEQSFQASDPSAAKPRTGRISFSSAGKISPQPKSSTEKPSIHPNTMQTLSSNVTPTISEFRRNAERQKREQESVGRFLSIIVYSLLGGVLLIAVLAGFGGYNLWKRINDQAVTVAQLDSKYNQQVGELKQELEQAKKIIAEQSALNQQQQDKIGRIASLAERLSAGLREEKDGRNREVAGLQRRLQRLEGRRTAQNE